MARRMEGGVASIRFHIEKDPCLGAKVAVSVQSFDMLDVSISGPTMASISGPKMAFRSNLSTVGA